MNTYLLFKSLHLISVISWMAGLLYLPRIFVYHSQNNTQQIISEVFKVMEKKLFFYIMTPAMILSWVFGLILIHEIGFGKLGQTWMILKLIFVRKDYDVTFVSSAYFNRGDRGENLLLKPMINSCKKHKLKYQSET